MSKLINKEALRQSLIKVKQYIDDKLFGNSESLKDLISEEISKGLSTIVDSAPEALDTLKEVADWITQDETHSAIIIESINKNTQSINEIKNTKADSTLSLESENPVMNKVITEELNKKASNDIVEEISSNISNIQSTLSSKADTNGTYPEMSVGIAEDLMGRPFTVDSAFTFRPTAGAENEIKDDYARIESIKGNSVVWNQKIQSVSDAVSNGLTISVDNGRIHMSGTIINANSTQIRKEFAIVSGHKYIFLAQNSGTAQSPDVWQIWFSGALKAYVVNNRFITASSSGKLVVSVAVYNGTIDCSFYLTAFDLTHMFGAGNEPSTIEEFYARIPQGIDLYAYNEGEVIHNNTDAVKSVGFNQWDEELELGIIGRNDNGDLIKTTSSTQLRSKNWIKVLPNTTYNAFCNKADFGGFFVLGFAETDGKNGSQLLSRSGGSSFTTKADTNYILFSMAATYGTTYNNDICINLSDTSRNGTYEPYISREQRLDIIGKYFPQGMKSAGTAHDEIRYNKATQKWEAVKRIGEVDLGTLDWSYQELNGAFIFVSDRKSKEFGIKDTINGMCSRYIHVSATDNIVFVDGYVDMYSKWLFNDGNIIIHDSRYSNAKELKNLLSGVMLYYELAEPIVTEIEEDINLDYEVWNGGTEQAIADTPSTPFSAVIEYDFNANETIRQNKANINKIKRALYSSFINLEEINSRITQLENIINEITTQE